MRLTEFYHAKIDAMIKRLKSQGVYLYKCTENKAQTQIVFVMTRDDLNPSDLRTDYTFLVIQPKRYKPCRSINLSEAISFLIAFETRLNRGEDLSFAATKGATYDS